MGRRRTYQGMSPRAGTRTRLAAPYAVAALAAGAVALLAGGCSDSSAPTDDEGARSAPTATDAARDRGAPSGRIVFTGDVGGNMDIYVIGLDGSGLTRLTTSDALEFDPYWSPDGKRIVYRHETDGGLTSEIYVMNADGSDQTNLTNRPNQQDNAPAWSPDGTMIAYASSGGTERPGIFVMEPDGSNRRRLTTGLDEYPAWSPDGSKLVFDRQTNGPTQFDLWVVNADGSGARPLVRSPADDQGAAWAPDGRTIAFQSGRGAPGNFDYLWTMKAVGSQERRLTQRFGERPVWTSDGKRIIFQAGGLYVLNVRTSRVTKIATPGLDPTFPDWRR